MSCHQFTVDNQTLRKYEFNLIVAHCLQVVPIFRPAEIVEFQAEWRIFYINNIYGRMAF